MLFQTYIENAYMAIMATVLPQGVSPTSTCPLQLTAWIKAKLIYYTLFERTR